MSRSRYDLPAIVEMVRPDLTDNKTRYRCTSCHRRKLRRHFGDNRTRPDGRAVQCKKCKRDASKAARDRSKAEIAKMRILVSRYVKRRSGNPTPTPNQGTAP